VSEGRGALLKMPRRNTTVTLLNALSKLFEISIYSSILYHLNHVNSNNLLFERQLYLCNRCVKIKVNDCYSDESPQGFIISGVPQGSILGPLLFLMYINDVSDEVQNCMLYLYADDCSIICQVDPHNNTDVANNFIQSDLNIA
jgi:hypothetical protein